ncbi:MAG: universal stress protein [Solirubrobacterales bacterium]|nr:universal stress protein [Solirubrobacterales bacterium]MBV8942385.1 universal stress protein [Solirubrobacterales bacterium]MBV9167308.1 universal stress protein [Solirubrobacterales bacterium]MBV9535703.1 universal stress protein [Solirubrobacterales bacterium]
MNTAETDERSVVIAYDGSPAARQAVAAAARILGACRVLVVTVWEEGLAYAGPATPLEGMTIPPMVEPGVALDVDRAVHGHAERVSNEGAALAGSLGLDAQPLAVPDDGNVAGTILSVASERQATAIVVGSRGLGGIRARLEGSTSKDLLRHAPCPVIVVHEAHEEQG